MQSKHQLAAIMFTDIVGYTALMGVDQDAALKLLSKNGTLHKSTIEQYNGKWLKERVMEPSSAATKATGLRLSIEL